LARFIGAVIVPRSSMPTPADAHSAIPYDIAGGCEHGT